MRDVALILDLNVACGSPVRRTSATKVIAVQYRGEPIARWQALCDLVAMRTHGDTQLQRWEPFVDLKRRLDVRALRPCSAGEVPGLTAFARENRSPSARPLSLLFPRRRRATRREVLARQP